MTYFYRLTDIVTCNLTELLDQAEDPAATLRGILQEMEQGLAGASRSVNTARAAAEKIAREIDDQRQQANQWLVRAKAELQAGQEAAARQALLRKKESEDLMAGLLQHQQAAQATLDHLETTHRALEARLADARRRQEELLAAVPAERQPTAGVEAPVVSADIPSQRLREVDDELAALKQELTGL